MDTTWYYYCPTCCEPYVDRPPGKYSYQELFGHMYRCSGIRHDANRSDLLNNAGKGYLGRAPTLVAFPEELQEACKAAWLLGGAEAVRQMAADIVHRAQEEGAGRNRLS